MNQPQTITTNNVLSSRWSLPLGVANQLAVAQRVPDSNQVRPLTLLLRVAACLTAILFWLASSSRIWATTRDGQLLVSARVSPIRALRRRLAGHVAIGLVGPVFAHGQGVPAWLIAVGLIWLGLRAAVLVTLVGDTHAISPAASHLLTDLIRHPNVDAGHAGALLDAVALAPVSVTGASCSPVLWVALYESRSVQTGEAKGRIKLVLEPRTQLRLVDEAPNSA